MIDKPIGIFDSGLGGLTVMKALMRELPQESMIYFGDTARVPYGNKSAQTIVRYGMEIASFLQGLDIKLLVIACNSVSAFALEKIQEALPIPVLGVLYPGAKAASERKNIGVLGTKATIESGSYQRAIQNLNPNCTIYPIACPLFVPLIEENLLDHPVTKMMVDEYLHPVRDRVDTLLLGCTHYPLIQPLIQEKMGKSVPIINSASACAKDVHSFLSENRMLSTCNAMYDFFVSDDPEKFCQSGERFLGSKILSVQTIEELPLSISNEPFFQKG